jgi:hypothetical protein
VLPDCFWHRGAAHAAFAQRLSLKDTKKIAVRCAATPSQPARSGRKHTSIQLDDGTPVTLDGPEDHVHHRGLMVAWSGEWDDFGAR